MKTMIVYYSQRGENLVNGTLKTLKIGNTEMAALILQKISGSDLEVQNEVETMKHWATL